ncbi:hypothetical protein QM012_003995 [Aureobasidium pullulans]|uniref:F-box domain-containing protein n=1 Tax=Aureobasidium pullulans TaxID=5580 RepID=A0ABR0T7C7_AURPU
MSFSDLDAVILLLIATHLQQDQSQIAQYATISRPWLSVVEAFTFRHQRVDSDERLRQLNQYLTPDRRAALRSLDVTIHLTKYGEDKWRELELESEKTINNQIFSTSLTILFKTINSWSTLAVSEIPKSRFSSSVRGPRHRFTLEIQAICKSDYYHMDFQDSARRKYISDSDCILTRHESNYLDLVRDLSPLPAVSELIIHGGAPRVLQEIYPRYVSAQAALRIVEACPFAETVELQLSDMESKGLSLRNNQRDGACARKLSSVPKTVTHLQLHYPGAVPQNQVFRPPIIPTMNGKDFFSSALNVLSQQLESLHLLAVVSDDLLVITSPTTHWPRLRHLHVDFDVAMPDGTWMFEQDPEDPHSEETDLNEDSEYQEMRMFDDRYDHEMPARFDWPRRFFTTAPNCDAYDRVNLAISKTTPRMPNLKTLRFSVDQGTAGCVCTYTCDGREIHKVLWKSCSTVTYEPNSEVVAERKRAVALRSGQLELQVAGIDDPTASDLVADIDWPRF